MLLWYKKDKTLLAKKVSPPQAKMHVLRCQDHTQFNSYCGIDLPKCLWPVPAIPITAKLGFTLLNSLLPTFICTCQWAKQWQTEGNCVIYIRVELKLVCIPLGTKWALELEVSWFSQWVLWWYPRFNSLCSFVSLWMNLQQHQNVNCWSHAKPGKVFHFYHWTQQQIQININQDF